MDLDFLQQQLHRPEVRVGLITTLAAFAIWRVPILGWPLYPFYLFGVFIHEISHGLVGILTGGRFMRFEIHPRRSGVAYTLGGNNLLITSAGYLGSALLGGVLFAIRSSGVSAHYILLALGSILGFFCLVFVRNWFGMLAGALLTAALIFSGLRLDTIWAEALLWLLSIHLFLYTFTRLFELFGTLHIPGQQSDAHMAAEYTGIPPALWLLLWFLIALGILVFAIGQAYH